MFKIVSRFYVIYGDGTPIYVGYTNRTVKKRFYEHKRDKDFEQYDKVKVKELVNEKLSFDFTWNYKVTCENAEIVSKREAELVKKYNTQGSCYQKADGGGQTWATEKSFVKSNRNNPKFLGMTTSQVKDLLDTRKKEQVWLRSFVRNMESPEHRWLHNFVSDMIPQERLWVGHFVSHMNSKEKRWLENFSNNMKLTQQLWLQDFVNSMKPQEQIWLSNFVGHMQPKEHIWLSNFVNHIEPKGKA